MKRIWMNHGIHEKHPRDPVVAVQDTTTGHIVYCTEAEILDAAGNVVATVKFSERPLKSVKGHKVRGWVDAQRVRVTR